MGWCDRSRGVVFPALHAAASRSATPLGVAQDQLRWLAFDVLQSYAARLGVGVELVAAEGHLRAPERRWRPQALTARTRDATSDAPGGSAPLFVKPFI